MLSPTRQELDDGFGTSEAVRVGRNGRQRFAVKPVRDADTDLIETAQRVQVHQGDIGGPAEPDRVAAGNSVEPTAAARPAGRRAILVTLIADAITRRIPKLAHKRPGTDTGRIGLHDTDQTRERQRR